MNNDDLSKQIPHNVKEFRYEDSIFIITNQKSIGFLIIKKYQREHLHFYQKNDSLGLVLTIESFDGTPKRHIEIDIKKSVELLAKILSDTFASAERLNLTDSRFIGKKVIFLTSHNLFIDKLAKKAAFFAHEYEVKEIPFENIDKNKNALGVIIDNHGVETDMLIVKDGDIHKLNLEQLDSKSNEFDSIWVPKT